MDRLVNISVKGCACLQVHSMLISSDGTGDPEVLAINAASAALSSSDIPRSGEQKL